MTTDRQHIYLSSHFWDDLWIVQQPVANEIQRTEDVLFVERFVSWFTVARYPYMWKRLFTWILGARRLTPRLRVLAPLPLFHLGHRWPRLFALEMLIQRIWILAWAGPIPERGRILWIDNPLFECALGRFGEVTSVYHVADEARAFPTSHPTVMDRLESKALQKVDCAFAAAESLATAKRVVQPRTYTIWNGVDLSIYLPDPVGRSSPSSANGPCVAFVGVIGEWVDLELLRDVAELLPHFEFVVVGNWRVDDRHGLKRLQNVRVLGRQPREAVPVILSQCLASLVPFKLNELTARIVPLKVFEALAAGALPICTPFSVDLRLLAEQGMVTVASTAEEFASAIAACAKTDSPEVRAARRRYGLRQTWQERWAQMRLYLDPIVESKLAWQAENH